MLLIVNNVIGRPGGKWTLKKEIIPLIPPHKTYIEPFFGGGSIFFGKAPSQKEIINDKDKLVVDIHKDVKKSKFCCDLTPNKKKWEKLKKKFDNKEKLTACEKIYLIKNSWAYKGDSYINKKKVKKTTVCFDKQHDRLKKATILNQDAKGVINKFDSKDAFFYIDPPYDGVCLYGKNLCNETPKELANLLKKIKGKFLLSYNPTPDVKNAFKDFKIKKTTMPYSFRKNGRTGKELLISNY